MRFSRLAPLGTLLFLASAALMALQTRFLEPPRGDGVGYAVLGASLSESESYRDIHRPDARPHAHFPPGYPLVLAAVWTVAGRSHPAAHVVSIAASASAVVLAWLWFRSLYPRRLALVLAAALALNWTWTRLGGQILSEPLYLLWQMLALVLTARVRASGKPFQALLLGLVLGLAVLTRYVGAPLAAALALDLAARKRFTSAGVASLATVVVLLPWIVWMLRTGQETHLGLLQTDPSLLSTLAHQSLFYLRRIPDQIVGPIVEVGTIYRRSMPLFVAVHLWASLATGLVLLGWLRTLRRPRTRLVGLWSGLTLALLLVWPFTEAGRFLVPLVPALLIGAVEGLAFALRPLSRLRASLVVLALSVPFSAYALLSGREQTARSVFEPFDRACLWIARHPQPPGPVLSNHPAEVFWQTGRAGWTPRDLKTDPNLDRRPAAYFLVEPGPEDDPLHRLVTQLRDRLTLEAAFGGPSGVRVYRLRPPRPTQIPEPRPFAPDPRP